MLGLNQSYFVYISDSSLKDSSLIVIGNYIITEIWIFCVIIEKMKND